MDLRMFIGGRWVESESGETFEATNPATGAVLARLPQGTREDARRAIAAANAARDRIAGLTPWERSRLCLRIAAVMERRQEELARVLSQDQGKPLHTEARSEIASAIEGFREAAEHIKWLETAVIPVADPHKRVFSIRQPRGVYAIVTPWNFPFNIPVEYLAPALAAGNAVVWVPAPTTSVCAVKLAECLEEAEVPPGVVNLVTGPGPVVGDEIVAHPGTDAVGFTGSAATGTHIAARAAGKPLLLELGGNGPTIILEDADISRAAECAAFGCFFNAGQVCCATERILVHERVHDALVDGLLAAARQVRLGLPEDEGTTMGPLNNQPVAEKMDRHLADAREKGAEVLFGGQRAPGFPTDLFYQPTVVDRVPEDSLLNTEETFGPVVPVLTFRTHEEALAIANACSLGLVSAVFTTSLRHAHHFAEKLRTGIVCVNDHTDYWELHIPFGGVAGKRSGVGRIGGKHAILEMTDLKTIAMDVR
ncbi:MAG: aldehyde dehydrogenase [Armatimonadetes bacterium]|nr:aldehyde dehydrogenase [Armatimonadota bacterium]